MSTNWPNWQEKVIREALDRAMRVVERELRTQVEMEVDDVRLWGAGTKMTLTLTVPPLDPEVSVADLPALTRCVCRGDEGGAR